MTRPIYETKLNRSNEDNFRWEIATRWQCVISSLPPLSAADSIAFNFGCATALLEIKCRTCQRNAYKTYIISKHKIDTLIATAESLKIMPILAVKWTDAQGWIDLTKVAPIRTEVGGRIDRNDPKDQEQVYHYPISRFVDV